MPESASESMDLEALRSAIRDVLEAECGLDRVQGCTERPGELCAELWAKAVQLGWPAIAIPERHGGLGCGAPELCTLFRELGRHLAPTPCIPTTVAAEALRLCTQDGDAQGGDAQGGGAQDGDVQGGDLSAQLAELAAGNSVAGITDPTRCEQLRLRWQNGATVLQGTQSGLADIGEAQCLVACATAPDGGPAILLLNRAGFADCLQLRAGFDGTRQLAELRFQDLSLPAAAVLRQGQAAAAIIGRMRQWTALALACDSLGGAERLFDLTLEYLRTRRQFDRPIGSFQALKHRCADLAVDLAAAEALLGDAIAAAGEDAADALPKAHSAKYVACETYARVAAEAVQLHGGIGFTWEHSCHLFLKRASLNRFLYGSTQWHQDRIAALQLRRNGAADAQPVPLANAP